MLRAKKILLSAFIFWLFISVFLGVELVGGKQLNGQGILLMVLWAGLAAQIVYEVKPELLSGQRWSVTAGIVMGLTIVWALFIRAEAIDSRAAAMNIVPLMLALGWAMVFRFYNKLDGANNDDSVVHKRHSHFWLIFTGVIILWGAWLRIAAIDAFVFENDEYYHVDAATGYLKTGKYVLWDHRLDQQQTQTLDKTVASEQTQPKEPYTRAWPYTWQVAQSIKIFGVSEWAMRLPALLWGLALLVLIPLVARSWSKSWEVGFYAAALAAFDGSYMWSSTYTRMYSMFWVLALVAVWFFVKALAASRERSIAAWLWLSLAIILTLASAVIHISGVLLVVGIFISCVVRYLRDRKNSWCAYVLLIFVVCGIAALLLHTARPFLPTAMVTLRHTVNVRYFKFPVSNLILPWLGLVTALSLAFITKVRQRDWVLLAASIFLPLTIYFVYFSPRYASRKYMAFFLFLFYILFAYTWQKFSTRLFSRTIARRVLGILIFAFLFLPLSFPSVAPSLIFQKARADLHYLETEFHDYKKAYEIIERAAAPSDALVILSPREYYLHRKDWQLYSIPVNREMTAEKLQKIVSEHGRGWIVWPKYKRFHLTDQFVNYVDSNFKRFEKAVGTNVIIYLWGS